MPERKLHFSGQEIRNPKHEIRNNDKNTNVLIRKILYFQHVNITILVSTGPEIPASAAILAVLESIFEDLEVVWDDRYAS